MSDSCGSDSDSSDSGIVAGTTSAKEVLQQKLRTALPPQLFRRASRSRGYIRRRRHTVLPHHPDDWQYAGACRTLRVLSPTGATVLLMVLLPLCLWHRQAFP